MDSRTWTVGNIKITSIPEIEAGKVIQDIIPDATSESIAQIPWLVPYFVGEDGAFKALVQAFVVESEGKRVLIDTGVGNGKLRPELSAWSNLHTNFLEKLESYDFSRESIDVAVCTHMHFDHVGWNTVWQNGEWVPTFSNAQYVFVKEEFDYWNAKPQAEIIDDHNGIADSVLPLVTRNRVKLVPADYKITSELALRPSFGHTPHHASVVINSGGTRAVITGDIFHHPCQIAHPEWMSFDTNKEAALASRWAFLKEFADSGTLILGSHFAAPTAGYIKKEGNGFRFDL